MNFKSIKLITLVVAAGLLSLLNLVTWTASGYSFEGPGLYKDGEKVLGFDLDLPEGITRTISDDTDVGQEVSKKKQFILDARKSAEEFADRFKEQKEFIKVVLECKGLVEEIKRKSDRGEDVELELGLLIQRKNELAGADREILRKFDEIEKTCREKGYSNRILDRQTKMVKQHKESTHILMRHLETVAKQRDRDRLLEEIEKLEKYFSENKFKKDPPLVNAQALPVNITKVKARVVEKGAPISLLEEIIISSTPPTQDDLDPTIDVQFTEDITNLANSLNNSPLKIYEYVRNNFEFEPYLGSRKGSQVTYEHRSGSDYDLASLLIALLRVSNIPARYATGMVEMPVDRAKNWLGVEDGATAGSILTTAGMEGVNVIDGDEVVAIRCRRVWVQAYIPYTNYRGIGNDDTGKMWISMDPAFKQYDYHPGVDIPAEMDFDAKAFVDDYISAFHEDSPVEFYQQEIIDYLAANHPELTYEDVLRTRDLHSETLGLIPGSLPYKLLSWDGEYSEIPADKRYQIRFHIHGEGSTLDYTANLPEIAGKQVTISYIGATTEDQQIIDDSGGLFGVEDPWLVHLKPVLKIDGCEAATGSGEVTMGLSHNSDMHFTAPVGAGNQVPAIYNTIIAGTYQGIGIDTWKVVTDFFAPMSTTCEESYTGYLLHDTALKYLGRVDMADEEVNKTMQIVLLDDVAEAIVEHVVKVTFSGGNPITFEWSGLRVDADRKIVGPFSVTGDDEGCNFMRLTGADGSISENRLFEDEFDEEAISAIKILELASDMGILIYEIDSDNIDVILPLLTVSASIKIAISDAVAAGHVVTIAQDNITHYDWTGTGYIDMDPDVCAAGYIISGGRSGGETVKEWTIDMSGVYCINATINSISPVAPNDIYCGEDTRALVFNVTIHPYDEDCNAGTDYTKNFSTADPPDAMTIKDIAKKHGGGEYTFYVGSTGGCPGKCGVATKSFTIVKVELNEITFGGTKCHNVTSDDGSTTYDQKHWLDPNGDGNASDGHSWPICFTRNTKIKTSVKWRIEPADPAVTIKLKGDGPGNIDFPETTATISGNDMTITDVECSNPFVNEVDFFDPLSIDWKFSVDGGSNWCDAGRSTNQTYVTLGDPLTTVYHTLAHLGCKNADGENNAANCTTKIWSEFTDRDVRRVDGVQLTYYASYTCGDVTTASLLANGDGQCGAWAKFFLDMRKVQHIDDPNEYVIFDPITDDGFIVKNWTFTGGGSSGHATHPYLNIPDSPLVAATSYNWKFAEVNDAAGIAGQGNANPASLFNNHQVVINGQYYDPSYGVKHATLQDIDNNAIDGFYIGPGTYPVDEPTVNLDLNGDGDKTDLGVNTTVMLFRKNPAGLDIKETRLNY